MRRLLHIGFGLLVLSTASANTLWDSAVELYAAHDDLLPGQVEARFDQYNGRGELVTTDTSTIVLWVDADGEIRSRVVSAQRNGQDRTDEQRESSRTDGLPFGGPPEGSGDDGPFSGLGRSPFDPDEQEHVRLTRIGRAEELDGVQVVPFDFEHRTSRQVVSRGTAWLDAESGEPVLLRLTIDPLPRFVGELLMEQHFARDDSGRWVVERLRFRGTGQVLFLRRRIESILIFSEYFPSEKRSIY